MIVLSDAAVETMIEDQGPSGAMSPWYDMIISVRPREAPYYVSGSETPETGQKYAFFSP
jgi:hypothetical protein